MEQKNRKKTYQFLSGPSANLCVFGYGGIHPTVCGCIARDLAFFAYRRGACESVIRAIGPLGLEVKADSFRLVFSFAPPDALISRARAIVVKDFLKTDMEVLVTVDHDITWQGADESKGYIGDLLHIIRRCSETESIVGAAVSKKVKGQGIASMWKDEGEYEIGSEGLVEMHYPGSGLTAYHRKVLQAVSNTMDEVVPGFKPIFDPMTVVHPFDKTKMLHLSEDWAFVHRAAQLGFKAYLDLRVLTQHWGEKPYTVVGDSQEDKQSKDISNINNHIANEYNSNIQDPDKIQIDLLHASRGRRELCEQSATTWFKRAKYPERIKRILSIDSDDEQMQNAKTNDETHDIVVGESKGCVDAYHRAFLKSIQSGEDKILVQMHDDVVPPENWDVAISEAIGNPQRECVLKVSDGNPVNPTKPWLITILIGTSSYFKRCGYFFYPEYVSVFCDDDVSIKASREGVVVDRPDIKFQHMWGGASGDETYTRSYRQENWKQGEDLFNKRKEARFPNA